MSWRLAQVALVTAPLAGPGEGAAQLARLNLSRDAAYAGRPRRKGERAAGALAKHATPAASLLTLPIKCACSPCTPPPHCLLQNPIIALAALLGLLAVHWHIRCL
jgi:hypothetical protein